MAPKTLRIVGVNALVLLGLLLLLEAGNQALAVVHPKYDVLSLEPDRVVGWKHVPNFRWTSTGPDFSVAVASNPLGFRDLPRGVPKPQSVKRVALLGDSFIEALQVPLSQTAGQILEHRLNRAPVARSEHSPQWEVLNFGMSGYSVGQYLLTWEQYASQYRPDFVVALISWLQMRRTTAKLERGAFAATKGERLWIRPTFRIENGSLIREPAKDFERFREAQAKVIAHEFDGARIRRRHRPLLTITCARFIRDRLAGVGSPSKSPDTPSVDVAAVREVNLKVICELGRQVEKAGAKLAIVDMTQYFRDGDEEGRVVGHVANDLGFASELEALSKERGFGYIPVYRDLLAANRSGVATRWVHDRHFNEAGNRILADALYEWISETVNSDRTATTPLTAGYGNP